MHKDILKRIPGFRTGSKLKMIFATIIYFFAIIIISSMSGATLRDKFIHILEFLVVFGIPYALVTNVGDIRSKLPIFNKKMIKTNILGGFIVFIIIITGFSVLNGLQSPEQKQLDMIATQQGLAKIEAKELDGKILALGDVNTLTLNNEDEIKSIRTAYEAFSTEQKGFVKKLDVIVSAEKKIIDLQAMSASDLDNMISTLGDVNTLTYDKVDDIKSIRTAYEALTLEQRGFVTKLEILEAAEKRKPELQAEAEKVAIEKAAAEKIAAEKAEKAEAEKIAAEKVAAEKAVAEKAVVEKAAAEKAATEKAAAEYLTWIDNQFSAWDGSNIHLVKLVKENLNDPKSFEHVETVYWDKGTYIKIKMTYRANNAFGGLILQNVTAKADYKSQYISIISQND